MKWFSSKVKVTFIDQATGKAFAVSEMSPSDLPESFEPRTTFHIGSDEWSVVQASLKTRAEFGKARALTLRLSRITRIDPKEILFSLPSIYDRIPGTGDQPVDGSEFLLDEDDWRQFELVSSSLRAEVDEEIASICLIHQARQLTAGWRKIHVRTKPEPPLACDLALDDLAHSLNSLSQLKGLTYRGASRRIIDGYSMTIPDALTIYGAAPNGKVQVIALGQYSTCSPSAESLNRLKALARDLELDLVHWCRCARVAPDDPLFDALLRK